MWDGNYVYISNYRMKTIGEDLEPIITSIEIDGVTYDSYWSGGRMFEEIGVIDYFYHNDLVYLIIDYTQDYLNKTAALICYNPLNKDYQILYDFLAR